MANDITKMSTRQQSNKTNPKYIEITDALSEAQSEKLHTTTIAALSNKDDMVAYLKDNPQQLEKFMNAASKDKKLEKQAGKILEECGKDPEWCHKVTYIGDNNMWGHEWSKKDQREFNSFMGGMDEKELQTYAKDSVRVIDDLDGVGQLNGAGNFNEHATAESNKRSQQRKNAVGYTIGTAGLYALYKGGMALGSGVEKVADVAGSKVGLGDDLKARSKKRQAYLQRKAEQATVRDVSKEIVDELFNSSGFTKDNFENLSEAKKLLGQAVGRELSNHERMIGVPVHSMNEKQRNSLKDLFVVALKDKFDSPHEDGLLTAGSKDLGKKTLKVTAVKKLFNNESPDNTLYWASLKNFQENGAELVLRAQYDKFKEFAANPPAGSNHKPLTVVEGKDGEGREAFMNAAMEFFQSVNVDPSRLYLQDPALTEKIFRDVVFKGLLEDGEGKERQFNQKGEVLPSDIRHGMDLLDGHRDFQYGEKGFNRNLSNSELSRMESLRDQKDVGFKIDLTPDNMSIKGRNSAMMKSLSYNRAVNLGDDSTFEVRPGSNGGNEIVIDGTNVDKEFNFTKGSEDVFSFSVSDNGQKIDKLFIHNPSEFATLFGIEGGLDIQDLMKGDAKDLEEKLKDSKFDKTVIHIKGKGFSLREVITSGIETHKQYEKEFKSVADEKDKDLQSLIDAIQNKKIPDGSQDVSYSFEASSGYKSVHKKDRSRSNKFSLQELIEAKDPRIFSDHELADRGAIVHKLGKLKLKRNGEPLSEKDIESAAQTIENVRDGLEVRQALKESVDDRSESLEKLKAKIETSLGKGATDSPEFARAPGVKYDSSAKIAAVKKAQLAALGSEADIDVLTSVLDGTLMTDALDEAKEKANRRGSNDPDGRKSVGSFLRTKIKEWEKLNKAHKENHGVEGELIPEEYIESLKTLHKKCTGYEAKDKSWSEIGSNGLTSLKSVFVSVGKDNDGMLAELDEARQKITDDVERTKETAKDLKQFVRDSKSQERRGELLAKVDKAGPARSRAILDEAKLTTDKEYQSEVNSFIEGARAPDGGKSLGGILEDITTGVDVDARAGFIKNQSIVDQYDSGKSKVSKQEYDAAQAAILDSRDSLVVSHEAHQTNIDTVREFFKKDKPSKEDESKYESAVESLRSNDYAKDLHDRGMHKLAQRVEKITDTILDLSDEQLDYNKEHKKLKDIQEKREIRAEENVRLEGSNRVKVGALIKAEDALERSNTKVMKYLDQDPLMKKLLAEEIANDPKNRGSKPEKHMTVEEVDKFWADKVKEGKKIKGIAEYVEKVNGDIQEKIATLSTDEDLSKEQMEAKFKTLATNIAVKGASEESVAELQESIKLKYYQKLEENVIEKLIFDSFVPDSTETDSNIAKAAKKLGLTPEEVKQKSIEKLQVIAEVSGESFGFVAKNGITQLHYREESEKTGYSVEGLLKRDVDSRIKRNEFRTKAADTPEQFAKDVAEMSKNKDAHSAVKKLVDATGLRITDEMKDRVRKDTGQEKAGYDVSIESKEKELQDLNVQSVSLDADISKFDEKIKALEEIKRNREKVKTNVKRNEERIIVLGDKIIELGGEIEEGLTDKLATTKAHEIWKNSTSGKEGDEAINAFKESLKEKNITLGDDEAIALNKAFLADKDAKEESEKTGFTDDAAKKALASFKGGYKGKLQKEKGDKEDERSRLEKEKGEMPGANINYADDDNRTTEQARNVRLSQLKTAAYDEETYNDEDLENTITKLKQERGGLQVKSGKLLREVSEAQKELDGLEEYRSTVATVTTRKIEKVTISNEDLRKIFGKINSTEFTDGQDPDDKDKTITGEKIKENVTNAAIKLHKGTATDKERQLLAKYKIFDADAEAYSAGHVVNELRFENDDLRKKVADFVEFDGKGNPEKLKEDDNRNISDKWIADKLEILLEANKVALIESGDKAGAQQELVENYAGEHPYMQALVKTVSKKGIGAVTQEDIKALAVLAPESVTKAVEEKLGSIVGTLQDMAGNEASMKTMKQDASYVQEESTATKNVSSHALGLLEKAKETRLAMKLLDGEIKDKKSEVTKYSTDKRGEFAFDGFDLNNSADHGVDGAKEVDKDHSARSTLSVKEVVAILGNKKHADRGAVIETLTDSTQFKALKDKVPDTAERKTESDKMLDKLSALAKMHQRKDKAQATWDLLENGGKRNDDLDEIGKLEKKEKDWKITGEPNKADKARQEYDSGILTSLDDKFSGNDQKLKSLDQSGEEYNKDLKVIEGKFEENKKKLEEFQKAQEEYQAAKDAYGDVNGTQYKKDQKEAEKAVTAANKDLETKTQNNKDAPEGKKDAAFDSMTAAQEALRAAEATKEEVDARKGKFEAAETAFEAVLGEDKDGQLSIADTELARQKKDSKDGANKGDKPTSKLGSLKEELKKGQKEYQEKKEELIKTEIEGIELQGFPSSRDDKSVARPISDFVGIDSADGDKKPFATYEAALEALIVYQQELALGNEIANGKKKDVHSPEPNEFTDEDKARLAELKAIYGKDPQKNATLTEEEKTTANRFAADQVRSDASLNDEELRSKLDKEAAALEERNDSLGGDDPGAEEALKREHLARAILEARGDTTSFDDVYNKDATALANEMDDVRTSNGANTNDSNATVLGKAKQQEIKKLVDKTLTDAAARSQGHKTAVSDAEEIEFVAEQSSGSAVQDVKSETKRFTDAAESSKKTMKLADLPEGIANLEGIKELRAVSTGSKVPVAAVLGIIADDMEQRFGKIADGDNAASNVNQLKANISALEEIAISQKLPLKGNEASERKRKNYSVRKETRLSTKGVRQVADHMKDQVEAYAQSDDLQADSVKRATTKKEEKQAVNSGYEEMQGRASTISKKITDNDVITDGKPVGIVLGNKVKERISGKKRPTWNKGTVAEKIRKLNIPVLNDQLDQAELTGKTHLTAEETLGAVFGDINDRLEYLAHMRHGAGEGVDSKYMDKQRETNEKAIKKDIKALDAILKENRELEKNDPALKEFNDKFAENLADMKEHVDKSNQYLSGLEASPLSPTGKAPDASLAEKVIISRIKETYEGVEWGDGAELHDGKTVAESMVQDFNTAIGDTAKITKFIQEVKEDVYGVEATGTEAARAPVVSEQKQGGILKNMLTAYKESVNEQKKQEDKDKGRSTQDKAMKEALGGALSAEGLLEIQKAVVNVKRSVGDIKTADVLETDRKTARGVRMIGNAQIMDTLDNKKLLTVLAMNYSEQTEGQMTASEKALRKQAVEAIKKGEFESGAENPTPLQAEMVKAALGIVQSVDDNSIAKDRKKLLSNIKKADLKAFTGMFRDSTSNAAKIIQDNVTKYEALGGFVTAEIDERTKYEDYAKARNKGKTHEDALSSADITLDNTDEDSLSSRAGSHYKEQSNSTKVVREALRQQSKDSTEVVAETAQAKQKTAQANSR